MTPAAGGVVRIAIIDEPVLMADPRAAAIPVVELSAEQLHRGASRHLSPPELGEFCASQG